MQEGLKIRSDCVTIIIDWFCRGLFFSEISGTYTDCWCFTLSKPNFFNVDIPAVTPWEWLKVWCAFFGCMCTVCQSTCCFLRKYFNLECLSLSSPHLKFMSLPEPPVPSTVIYCISYVYKLELSASALFFFSLKKIQIQLTSVVT